MRFLMYGFFNELIVPMPRVNPQNIFVNIFVFDEIFTKMFTTSGYHYLEVVVSLLLGLTIAGYHYSEDIQFPSIIVWKSVNFKVSLPRNCQFPGNDTRKFTDLQPQVTISGNRPN